jgi:mono/diheme cytochrome c family protein
MPFLGNARAGSPIMTGSRLRNLLAAVVAAAFAVGVASNGQAGRAGDPASRGHQIARQACAACHAVELTGESPRAAAPTFRSREMRHTAGLDGRVADLTREGHYEMPAIKLRPDQVRDLVAYIESLDSR